jgi:alginate biosynthesis protein Alg44
METAPLALTPPVIAPLSAGNDHPMVDLPFNAIIDGRQFRGHGLSLVSAHVVGLLGTSTTGTPRIVRLVFDFDGFAVTLVLLADVHEVPGGGGEVQLDFTQPAGPHLPQLRHILNAFIAGDLVALGTVIGVAGTTPPKPVKATAAGTGRRVAQGTGLAALALLLIALAGGLVYQRSFVHLLPDLGAVALQGETLRATSSGQIAFLDTAAPQGQVALAITTASGDVLSLTMPCDCKATSLGLRVGSTVLAGEPVLQLTTPNAPVVVLAPIPPAMAYDVARGDRVEVTLPDGRTVTAKATLNASQPAVLTPDAPLPATLVGQPVQVRLIRDGGWLGQQINLAREWFLRVTGV